MIIEVQGRKIDVDDKLAKKYEEAFFEPLNEKAILTYTNGDVNEMTSSKINEYVKRDILFSGKSL